MLYKYQITVLHLNISSSHLDFREIWKRNILTVRINWKYVNIGNKCIRQLLFFDVRKHPFLFESLHCDPLTSFHSGLLFLFPVCPQWNPTLCLHHLQSPSPEPLQEILVLQQKLLYLPLQERYQSKSEGHFSHTRILKFCNEVILKLQC